MNLTKKIIIGCITLCLLLSLGVYVYFKSKESKSVNDVVDDKVVENKESKVDKKNEQKEDVIEEVIEEEIEETHFIQINQSIQETSYYCVPATVQMTLGLHNITKTQDELAKEMQTSSITGTEYVDAARILNRYIFNTDEVKNGEPGYYVQTLPLQYMNDEDYSLFQKRVKQDIEHNDPIFVAVDLNVLYPLMPRVNHMILIHGYTVNVKSGEILSFTYTDPYEPVHDNENGGLKQVDQETLRRAIGSNEEPAYIY